MTNKEKLVIRFEERLRVYKDSPTVQVTYVDLVHLVENLLEIIEVKELNGFRKDESIHKD